MKCLWLLALLLPSLAAANGALTEGLIQCRAERDADRRLACYDALAAAQAAGSATPTAPTRSTAVSSAIAPKSVEAPVPAVPNAARFGLPEVKAPALVEAVESEIEGRFTGWRPGDRVRLRNGQLWQIADDSAGSYDLTQPKVRVEKGRFGSFFLRIEGVAQTPKVRRLQ